MGDIQNLDTGAELDDELPAMHAEVVADLRTAFLTAPEPHVAEEHVRKMVEVAPPARVIPLRPRPPARRRAAAVACAVVATVGIGGTWAAAEGHLPGPLQSIASAIVEPFGIDWPDGTQTDEVEEPASGEPGVGGDDTTTGQDETRPTAAGGVNAERPGGNDRSVGGTDSSVLPTDPEAGEQGSPGASGQSQATPPGQSGQTGQSGESQGGRPAVPPGLEENPGNRPETPPGQSDGFTPPGQGGTPPGQGGTPPGQAGTPPGQTG
jgi:hypothetical protein